MEKEFIPYTEALALKELGFDDITLGVYYINDDDREVVFTMPPYAYGKGFGIYKRHNVLAPLYQQAFRWFREEHNLHTWITSKTNDKGKIMFIPQGRTVPDTIKNNLTVDIIPYYTGKSNEEAQLECLKKLIEIVKEKSK